MVRNSQKISGEPQGNYVPNWVENLPNLTKHALEAGFIAGGENHEGSNFGPNGLSINFTWIDDGANHAPDYLTYPNINYGPPQFDDPPMPMH